MSKIENFEDYKKYSALGAELYNRKDYAKALPVFQELARVNYDNFKVHETLAYIHLYMKNVDQAEKEFKIAMEIARRESGILEPPKTFDDLVKEAGDIQQVEADYRTVLEKSDEEVLHHSRTAIHLGILYMSQGKYSQAEEVLSRYRERCLQAIG